VTEVICTGPLPPVGEKWCTMCAIRYKTDAFDLEDVRAEVESLQTGDGKPVHFDLARAVKGRVIPPEVSVTIGVCLQLNGMLVPLCWGHVQAIKFTNVQPAAAGQVPLLTGKR
jgi:hypothetical protein